eukprot:11934506-Ditylum_brightwellii.AAC.1
MKLKKKDTKVADFSVVVAAVKRDKESSDEEPFGCESSLTSASSSGLSSSCMSSDTSTASSYLCG